MQVLKSLAIASYLIDLSPVLLLSDNLFTLWLVMVLVLASLSWLAVTIDYDWSKYAIYLQCYCIYFEDFEPPQFVYQFIVAYCTSWCCSNLTIDLTCFSHEIVDENVCLFIDHSSHAEFVTKVDRTKQSTERANFIHMLFPLNFFIELKGFLFRVFRLWS